MTRPRIRTLKPETWQDEKVGTLSRDARLLLVGLITMADDEGRLRAMPAAVLGHIFPYDADALRKLSGWLDEVVQAGLVVAYQADGKPYLAFRNWRRHQRINRGTPSQLPASPDPVVTADNAIEVAEKDPDRYRKKAIPEKTRREVAKREGAIPGEVTVAQCHYCERAGEIIWQRLANGKPGSWVTFRGLELDHVHPEFHGGSSEPENIVLSCQWCNRSKGHGITENGSPQPNGTESRTEEVA